MVQQKFFPTMMLSNDVCWTNFFRLMLSRFVRLVLPVDLERIENTFRELTNTSGELSYTSFKRDVFANFLPEKLATVRGHLLMISLLQLFFFLLSKRLYQVCTSSSRSCMSLKDLVCCLALIYYGTVRERMQRKRTSSRSSVSDLSSFSLL